MIQWFVLLPSGPAQRANHPNHRLGNPKLKGIFLFENVLLVFTNMQRFLAKNYLLDIISQNNVYGLFNNIYKSVKVKYIIDIAVTIHQLKGLVSYFQNYRKMGFEEANAKARQIGKKIWRLKLNFLVYHQKENTL